MSRNWLVTSVNLPSFSLREATSSGSTPERDSDSLPAAAGGGDFLLWGGSLTGRADTPLRPGAGCVCVSPGAAGSMCTCTCVVGAFWSCSGIYCNQPIYCGNTGAGRRYLQALLRDYVFEVCDARLLFLNVRLLDLHPLCGCLSPTLCQHQGQGTTWMGPCEGLAFHARLSLLPSQEQTPWNGRTSPVSSWRVTGVPARSAMADCHGKGSGGGTTTPRDRTMPRRGSVACNAALLADHLCVQSCNMRWISAHGPSLALSRSCARLTKGEVGHEGRMHAYLKSRGVCPGGASSLLRGAQQPCVRSTHFSGSTASSFRWTAEAHPLVSGCAATVHLQWHRKQSMLCMPLCPMLAAESGGSPPKTKATLAQGCHHRPPPCSPPRPSRTRRTGPVLRGTRNVYRRTTPGCC